MILRQSPSTKDVLSSPCLFGDRTEEGWAMGVCLVKGQERGEHLCQPFNTPFFPIDAQKTDEEQEARCQDDERVFYHDTNRIVFMVHGDLKRLHHEGTSLERM